MNWTVRQLTFSAMRDAADCSTGALWSEHQPGHNDGERTRCVDLLRR